MSQSLRGSGLCPNVYASLMRALTAICYPLAECTVIAERRSLVAAAPGRMSVFLSERGRVVCRPALLLDYRGPHLCPTDAENVDQEVHV